MSYTVTTLLNLVAIKKLLDFSYKDFASSLVIQLLVAVISVFGVSFIKNLTVGLPVFISILVPSTFGIAFFMIANLALGQIDVSGFVSKKRANSYQR